MAKPRQSKRNPPRKAKTENLALRDVAPLFRVPRNVDHHFVRTWSVGTLSAGASDQGWGYGFTLQQLPNYTELTALYDTYRIDAIEAIWELVPTASGVRKTSSVMPVVLAYPDYDDGVAPASLSEAEQQALMERLQLSEARPAVRRRISPRVNFGLEGASANLGGNMAAPFADCSYPAIIHYGVKFWIKSYNTASLTETGAAVSVAFRFHLTLRNPR